MSQQGLDRIGKRERSHVQVIKLSDSIQRLPRQATSFVHGAAPMFLEEGSRKAKQGQGILHVNHPGSMTKRILVPEILLVISAILL